MPQPSATLTAEPADLTFAAPPAQSPVDVAPRPTAPEAIAPASAARCR